MATVKKLIGRLPVYKGDWVAGSYSMLNQVTYLGSTFQSKIDNNTAIPATVVNNALQVNENWSIVSNGTAAYLADSRLTVVEDKANKLESGVATKAEQGDLDRLEQELSVARGGVQGVSWKGWVKHIESFKSIAIWISGEDIGTIEFREVFVGNIGLFFGGGTDEIFISHSGTNYNTGISRISGNMLIVLSIDATGLSFYLNSVKSQADINIPITTIDISEIFGGWKMYQLRTFNTSLTQSIVDQLYNQGRCDEVQLGDYYYNNIGIEVPIVKDVSDQTNFSKTTNENGFFELGTDVALNSGCRYLTTFNIKKNDGSIPSEINLYTAYHFGCEQFYYDNTTGDVSYLLSPKDTCITLFYPIKLEVNTTYNITNFKCKRINILNEYLPNYLTKTKWIDNGVSKQDIALTAPTFTYIKPYKQHLFGSGAPSTPPDAAFVEYSDTVTGNIWKCGTKPNTRKFAVTDWKQINN